MRLSLTLLCLILTLFFTISTQETYAIHFDKKNIPSDDSLNQFDDTSVVIELKGRIFQFYYSNKYGLTIGIERENSGGCKGIGIGHGYLDQAVCNYDAAQENKHLLKYQEMKKKERLKHILPYGFWKSLVWIKSRSAFSRVRSVGLLTGMVQLSTVPLRVVTSLGASLVSGADTIIQKHSDKNYDSQSKERAYYYLKLSKDILIWGTLEALTDIIDPCDSDQIVEY